MVERGDFVAARSQGRQYAAYLGLLDDLGWDPGERRENYALTLPPAELAEALERFRRDVEEGLEEPEEVRRRAR